MNMTMTKEELLARTNAKLQNLVETALDFVAIAMNEDEKKFETYRRVLLNKYNALKKANMADFTDWEDGQDA
jgi:hypothetical protein